MAVNNNVKDALVLAPNSRTVAFNNTGGGKEPGEGGNAGNTVWYVWYPKPEYHGQNMLFGAGGFDVYLGLWEGPEDPTKATFGQDGRGPNNMTLVRQDDDSNINDGTQLGGSNNSSFYWVVDSKKTYYFQAGGYSSNQGNMYLNYPAAGYPPFQGGHPRPSVGAYGTRTYGNGTGLIQRGPVQMGMVSGGGSTVSMGVGGAGPTLITKQGDIVLMATDVPSDIELVPAEGPDTLASGPGGVATMSIDTWQSHSVSSRPVGVSANTINLGQRFTVRATAVGVGGARDQFGVAGKWYMGSSTHMQGLVEGKATGSCNLTVQEFPTPIYLYPSYPTGNDVLLAPDTGPGEQASIVSTAQGIATVSFSQTSTHKLQTDMAGRAGARDQFGAAGKWYLGSSTHLAFTSVGKGKWADVYMGSPFHVTGTSAGRTSFFYNYLGSPFRVTSTSAGRAGCTRNNVSGAVYIQVTSAGQGGARDQFGTTGKWYLGSPHRVAMVSSGRAAMSNYLSTPVPVAVLFTGRATANIYLGSPFHVISESKGKATVNAYLASQVYFAGTSPGRATVSIYLGSPFHVQSTSVGKATVTGYLSSAIYLGSLSAGRAACTSNYLSSPIGVQTTFRGYGGGSYYLSSPLLSVAVSRGKAGCTSNYLSSPVRMETRSNGRAFVYGYLSGPVEWLFNVWTSNGVSTVQQYLADPFDLPAATSNGVSANTAHHAGLVLLNSRAIRGISTATMQPHRGPVHYGVGEWTSRGVATMFLDPGLLYMTSNGVGHVNNIPRPDQVWMRWGSGEWFYERHYPLIAPLLIPNGSNGFAYVEITPDTMHPLHDHIDGVSSATITAAGIERQGRIQTVTAGCFDWTVYGEDAEAGLTGTRRPWFYAQGALNVQGTAPVYQRQPSARTDLSITMTLTPVPVVWWPKGIATVKMLPTINFYRRWQTWTDGEPFYPYREGYSYNGPHWYRHPENGWHYNGTRRAGGVGTMAFKGPYQVGGIAYARGGAKLNRLGVAFASNLIANGVSLNQLLNIGAPLDLIYGDMLAINFSVPVPPYGQLWPRRFHLSGLPV